ncbi:MAG TPA: hypothetical protein VJT33_15510 [bacterium]|nr:hypothetical protein [bacterium]
MGSNTPLYRGLYQNLAEAVWEIIGADGVIVTRFDRPSMTVRVLAAAPVRAIVPRGVHGAVPSDGAAAPSVLRRLFVTGLPVSVALRAMRGSAAPRRARPVPSTEDAGHVTMLPLRARGEVTGAFVAVTARKPRPAEVRRYEAAARLLGLVFAIDDGARQSVGRAERARRDAAAVLHGTHAALLALRHGLGENEQLRLRDPAQADAMIGRTHNELERIAERDLGPASRSLYPLVIRMSVSPALETLIERYAAGGAQIAVRIDPAVAELDDPFGNRLPEGLRLAIYRIAEAAVAAAATGGHINIVLRRDGGRSIRLDMAHSEEDAAAAWRELGEIVFRAQEWNGSVVISRRPSGGATLRASFPLQAAGRADP